MSASLSLIAWCSAIGLPNASRSVAVARRRLERGAGDPDAGGGHVDPAPVERRQHLVEPCALLAAEQVAGRDARVVEVDLAQLDAPVAELADRARHAAPRRVTFHGEQAHAAMRRRRGRVGDGEHDAAGRRARPG